MPSRCPTAISTLLGLVLIGTSACFYSPFLRNDGPSQSQGVAVSLARQRCSFDPPWTRPDQSRGYLDLWMRLQVRNDTQQIITIDPQQMRLLVRNFAVDKTAIVGEIRRLAPSKTDNVDVRFRQEGDFGCNAQMSLSLKECIRVGTQPIKLRPVTFISDAHGSESSEDTAAPSQGFVVTTD